MAYLGRVRRGPWGAVPGVGLLTATFAHVAISRLLQGLAIWGWVQVRPQDCRALASLAALLAGELLTSHAAGRAVDPAVPVRKLSATVQLPRGARVWGTVPGSSWAARVPGVGVLAVGSRPKWQCLELPWVCPRKLQGGAARPRVQLPQGSNGGLGC